MWNRSKCTDCRYKRLISNQRGSSFWLCTKSKEDPRFPKYPIQPQLQCRAYETQQNSMNSIKNILFDFGGVLYEIDINRMLTGYNAMIKDTGKSLTFSMEQQHEMFSKLETGQIEIDDFAEGLKEAYQLDGSKQQIIDTWNSLLVGLIPGRVEAIQILSKSYKLALLSNTNAFHFAAFKEEASPIFKPMEGLFLSFEMGVRKPFPEIYQRTLEALGWEASETLFIDDGIANCETARSLGMQVRLYRNNDDFKKLMEEA